MMVKLPTEEKVALQKVAIVNKADHTGDTVHIWQGN